MAPPQQFQGGKQSKTSNVDATPVRIETEKLTASSSPDDQGYGSTNTVPKNGKPSNGTYDFKDTDTDLRLCDLKSQYPFIVSDKGSHCDLSVSGVSSSFSFSESADCLLNKEGNRQRLLDFSQSLPHVKSKDRKSSNFLTSMNVFCVIQGVSIFAMPFVTVKCFVPVTLLTIYIGIVNWFTAYLLVECQHQISVSRPGERKRVYPTYIDLGIAAFKTHGEVIMKIVTTTIVVSGIAFFILLGQITYDTLHSKLPLTTQHWIVIWAAIVIPSLYIERVSVMAWFSMIGTASITLAVVLISGVLLSNYKNWNMDNINWGFDLEYFFLGYGIIQNSFFVHLIVPSIEGSMVKPENCHQVMAVSFAVNTGFKIIFQAMAALTFGINIQQSVTSNIDSPISISLLVNILTAINLYCGFPIIFCVLFEMMDNYVLPSFTLFDKKKKSSHLAWKTLSRLVTMAFVVFISVSIPQFGLVVSFLGNLRSTFAAMLLPLIFFIKLKWNHTDVWHRVASVSILISAAIMGIGACYFTIKGIISSFRN